ncbi:PilL N-terminal domain-containing protein [Xenorhabdus bovienii]|uniref:PFGI-1 class ICE element type IV pilus protein PilL2 n=1 Tax=Xenorhabdus bovienii TaxID=40576 RepID=UPI00237D1711|nr:PilL N-terminal domain-containing protein [Xenorhabdus bovienii]MDE1485132.1 PilL N-terminal domain-containing protein [Xenorhabdus bovienii]MDE9475995.1 PilL N-terminal domain-containing protein [Xenorhabdus bovienii]MDE9528764.1 PilL N-terminal domain-containing protein [Xenorhabdus bovienii]
MKKSAFILLSFALTACVKQQTSLPTEDVLTAPVTSLSNVSTVTPDVYQSPPSVVRYDRYLLIDTSPEVAQRYPLEQVINLKVPASLKPTVGEAIHYALRQSGYRLCSISSQADTLYQKPLPAVQYQLGPIRLSTALQVLAGPAWQLEVDEVQRVICHSLRVGYQLPPSEKHAPVTLSNQSTSVKLQSISTPLPDIKPVITKNKGWLVK